ncbi:MAG: PilZ domain-containing protein [Polyangiales bacterium]
MGHARATGDRRSSHRVDLDGRAVLFQRGGHVGQYRLENISAGGAMIAGDRDLRPGHLVHVLLDFDSGDETMSLTGSVRRVRAGDNGNNGVGLAIAFPVLSADQEDAIHNAVLRALLRREAGAPHLPLLVFEPRRRVREEIESEIRSFGLPVSGVESLEDAVRQLEDEETEYAGLVIHSVTHDPQSMDVIEFFTRSENLRTIILPDPNGALCERAERLAKLAQVRVPRIWSRAELRRALTN